MTIVCDRIVKWGLAALVAFTPLAFGTVEAWAIALMEWGIFTLLLVFLLGRLWATAESPRAAIRWSGLELPLGLFLVFCALQTAPHDPVINQYYLATMGARVATQQQLVARPVGLRGF